MTNKEHKFEPVSISAEEVWKSLEEQNKTGVLKQAREMAGIAREQLEYAFNHGYETAKAKYSRPQGHWINSQVGQTCSICNEIQFGYDSFRNFCPNCGAEMKVVQNDSQGITREVSRVS